MLEMFKKQRVLSSVIIGTILAIMIAVPLTYLNDIRNFPLTEDYISIKMSESNIISFANVQGSRVYVASTQDGLVAFMFEVASFTQRFRFLWEMNIREIDRAIILGRYQHFQVFITASGDIEYNQYTGDMRNLHTRPYKRLFVNLLLLSASASSMVFLTIKNTKSKT